MNELLKYGWRFLLLAIIGEILIPFVLALFYKGYNHSVMAISSLGNVKSPVRIPFNLWMLVAGILFLLSTPAIYHAYQDISKPLSITCVLFMSAFAVGACIFSCLFSVNETKDIVTTSSRIHGAGSAIGFMLLLFVPLFIAILSFKSEDKTIGVISSVSFILAILFFILFIMADKSEFQYTIIVKEGLWQRLNLFFMYLPLGCIAIRNID